MSEPLTDARAIFEDAEAEYGRDRSTAREALRGRYVGRMARFELLVEEVRQEPDGRPYLVLVPEILPERPSRVAVMAFFPRVEDDRIKGFVVGVATRVEGEIHRVVRGGLFLEGCRLV